MEKKRYTYVIQSADGAVKIGQTSDPHQRFRHIQSDHADDLVVLALIRGCKQERRLHAMFERHHIRGEWYRYGDGLREYIESLCFAPVKVDDFRENGEYVNRRQAVVQSLSNRRTIAEQWRATCSII